MFHLFEISLRMSACRTVNRSFLALEYETTVATLLLYILSFLKFRTCFYIIQ